MLQTEAIRAPITVGDLMTAHPITIDEAATVAHAAERLRACRIRHLPVVERHGAMTGIISLRDVIAADDALPVRDIMSAPVETARADLPLGDGCALMCRAQRSSLPIVDGAALRGIFTATDALRLALVRLAQQGSWPATTVAQLMTPQPLQTIEPDDELRVAWERMRAAHVRHLPVVHDDALVGLLTDRDVLAAGHDFLRAAAPMPALRVADAMGPRLVTIASERPAVDAAEILWRRRLGALVVVRGRQPIGILTVTDFLYWLRS